MRFDLVYLSMYSGYNAQVVLQRSIDLESMRESLGEAFTQLVFVFPSLSSHLIFFTGIKKMKGMYELI